MPSNFSRQISFDKFRKVAHHFVSRFDSDVLLGSAGYSDVGKSYLCIGRQDELILDSTCGAEEIYSGIKRFAFADSRPVVGYLSYECGYILRGIATDKKYDFPIVHLKKYAAVLEHDCSSGECGFVHGEKEYRSEVEGVLACEELSFESGLPRFDIGEITMSLPENEYREGVARTLEHIRDGVTYQLNLTTKFSMPGANIDPVDWFFSLNRRYPAPYYAFFRSAQKAIVSTSPELFLRVEEGRVCSEPIKGTLKFDAYSMDLEQQLVTSAKEDSELSMIVDLVRNDISADCSYGSVVVEKHKSVFAVDNLLQMYSRVCGCLAGGHDCVDLLLNAFPGGSITGCPKKSSMELIDSLEPHTRGPYCGSVVFIRGPQDMVSSIAIRTAVHAAEDNKVYYWAGSGIVIDSDPEAEYQETMAKAGKILNPEML